LNKAQASGLSLEKQITELKESLKKCQDKKVLVETTLHDSKKDLEKLNKACEDDLKMIENLRKEADRSTKTVDDLSSNNSKLAKTLSTKE
jgi:chromosome segregation ATPase